MTKQLSSAAQAVMDAAADVYWDWSDMSPASSSTIAAAALRAAAEIVAPLTYEDVWTDGRMLQYKKEDPIREKLLAIADEIESL